MVKSDFRSLSLSLSTLNHLPKPLCPRIPISLIIPAAKTNRLGQNLSGLQELNQNAPQQLYAQPLSQSPSTFSVQSGDREINTCVGGVGASRDVVQVKIVEQVQVWNSQNYKQPDSQKDSV